MWTVLKVQSQIDEATRYISFPGGPIFKMIKLGYEQI